MTTILDTLKGEHDRLRELFAQITATADSEADARHDLLEQSESGMGKPPVACPRELGTRIQPRRRRRSTHQASAAPAMPKAAARA